MNAPFRNISFSEQTHFDTTSHHDSQYYVSLIYDAGIYRCQQYSPK